MHDHDCIQEGRIVAVETDTKRFVPWSLGISLVSGAFGVCCLGFLLLHGMIVSDRAEAMAISLETRTDTDKKLDKLADIIESRRVITEKNINDILKGQFEIMAAIRK